MRVPGRGGFTKLEVTLFSATVMALALLPWLVPDLPTQDGPNHVAVAHILIHYDDPGAPFRDYWTIEPGFKPSALYYRLLVAIGPRTGLFIAEKVLTSVAIAALPLSVLFFLRRVVPERSRNVFLVLPLVTGWAVAMGFLSYVLALALGYVALALGYTPPSDGEGNAPLGLRHAAAAVILGVSAYLHPVVSVLSGSALLLLHGKRRLFRPATLRNVILVTAPAGLLMAVACVSTRAAAHDTHAVTRWISLAATLSGVLEYQVAYSRWELLPRGAALFLLLGCAGLGLRTNSLRGCTVESAVARVVLAFLCLYLVMPQVLSDWWYCSARFLLFAAFLLPAAVVPEGLSPFVPALGVALTGGVLLAMSSELARLGTQIEDVVVAGASLPRGAKFIPLDFTDRDWGSVDKPEPLTHAWAWLVVDRDAVAPEIFAAGRPGMGGERFRTLVLRPGVLDVASGTLPWPASESTYRIVNACKAPSSASCHHELSERKAAIDAVADRYQALLMVAPPPYAREAFAKDLRLLRRTGDVFVYELPSKAGVGTRPQALTPTSPHQATAARM